jgi:hypothetical protein
VKNNAAVMPLGMHLRFGQSQFSALIPGMPGELAHVIGDEDQPWTT